MLQIIDKDKIRKLLRSKCEADVLVGIQLVRSEHPNYNIHQLVELFNDHYGVEFQFFPLNDAIYRWVDLHPVIIDKEQIFND